MSPCCLHSPHAMDVVMELHPAMDAAAPPSLFSLQLACGVVGPYHQMHIGENARWAVRHPICMFSLLPSKTHGRFALPIRLTPTDDPNDHAYAKWMVRSYCSSMDTSPTGNPFTGCKLEGRREAIQKGWFGTFSLLLCNWACCGHKAAMYPHDISYHILMTPTTTV
jgi:hypothetical protein